MKRQRPIAFVIGPYRADHHNSVHENILQARRVAVHLWQLGFTVITPHMNSAWLSGSTDEGHFLTGYLDLLRLCDVAVTMDRWEESEGARDEVKQAISQGQPVIHQNDTESLKEFRDRWLGGEHEDFTITVPADVDKDRVLTVLKQIVEDLPNRRDWLAPDLEAEARFLVADRPNGV